VASGFPHSIGSGDDASYGPPRHFRQGQNPIFFRLEQGGSGRDGHHFLLARRTVHDGRTVRKVLSRAVSVLDVQHLSDRDGK
jgi:hypothetical protein